MGIPNYIEANIFDNSPNIKEFSCIMTNIAWNKLVNNINSRSNTWANHSNIEIVRMVNNKDIIVSD